MTNNLADNVSVINAIDDTVVTQIPVGKRPVGVVANPQKDEVYVANSRDDTVCVLDSANLKVSGHIRVGNSPVDLAVSSDGRTLYVANELDNTVSVVNLREVVLGIDAPQQGKPSPTLWVEVSGGSEVKVFGTVIPPSFHPRKQYDTWPHFDRIDFSFNEKEKRFEAQYEKFTEAGIYTLIIKAQSPDGRSDPVQTTVKVELPRAVSTSEKELTIWGVVKRTALLQNYPNPFNPETWMPFQLAEASFVTIQIYNVNGQLIQELSLGLLPVGAYVRRDRAAYWDGRTRFGEVAPSGLYFYRLQVRFADPRNGAGDFEETRRMLLLK